MDWLISLVTMLLVAAFVAWVATGVLCRPFARTGVSKPPSEPRKTCPRCKSARVGSFCGRCGCAVRAAYAEPLKVGTVMVKGPDGRYRKAGPGDRGGLMVVAPADEYYSSRAADYADTESRHDAEVSAMLRAASEQAGVAIMRAWGRPGR